MFSYETHFGEVSGMSSQCSKLNRVSCGKSPNLQKQFFYFRNYVHSANCARGSCITCQAFSVRFSWTHENTWRKKMVLGCFFFLYPVWFTWLITSVLNTLHGQYQPFYCLIMWSTWKKKSDPLTTGGPIAPDQISKFNSLSQKGARLVTQCDFL